MFCRLHIVRLVTLVTKNKQKKTTNKHIFPNGCKVLQWTLELPFWSERIIVFFVKRSLPKERNEGLFIRQNYNELEELSRRPLCKTYMSIWQEHQQPNEFCKVAVVWSRRCQWPNEIGSTFNEVHTTKYKLVA